MHVKWTVILMYPDYVDGGEGTQFFIDYAEANTREEAVAIVRSMAELWDTDEEIGNEILIPAQDFRVVGVIRGYVDVEYVSEVS
jgi:hypothetical protein